MLAVPRARVIGKRARAPGGLGGTVGQGGIFVGVATKKVIHKGTEEDVTRVMTENQIFWGASRVGRNGFDLLEDYKRHPDRVLNFLRSRGVSIRL
mmetsp:Transcript_34556/g.101474  ORF Transcript_34556/g.101474 Transcript_34556/m.101474 type:complete len:95 (-) Transcript_34556:72-356(-)